MSDWPFAGLKPHHYGAILADPPWSFATYGGDHTTPHRTEIEPYPVLSLAALQALPVAELAAADCALFLWVVDPLLDAGIEMAKAWGFNYRTRAFEWLKTTNDGAAYRVGMGYWTRKQAESCLLFTRGKPKRLSKSVRQIIEEPRREHSRKPDDVYRRIEALVAGPYCELFATRRWVNWDGWGNSYPTNSFVSAVARLSGAINGCAEKL